MPWLEKFLTLSRCPHCGIASPNLLAVSAVTTKNSKGTNQRVWRFYACQTCGGVVSACSTGAEGIISEMYPQQPRVNENVPNTARNYLSQAIDSLHAPAGAVMLAASAIDAMLKNKGYSKGHLYPRIEQAAKDHLITEEMAKWAHEIRLDANDQRHADEEAGLPTDEQAKKCIDFAQALAEFLFVLPSRVERGLREAQPVASTKDSNEGS